MLDVHTVYGGDFVAAKTKKSKLDSRIWELDALRGFMILCVIVVHTLFDLEGIININYPDFYIFIRDNGGILFIILSGICATLGSKTFVRGLIVFASGMLITLVTYSMYHFNYFDRGMIITFGILHMLGICMIVYPVFKNIPKWLVLFVGIAIIVAGIFIADKTSEVPFSYVIGVPSITYAAGDYFPLIPYSGWFFVGIFLGKTIYKNKKSLMPNAPKDFFLIKFLRLCGKYSLYIYLIHQPVVYGLISAILYLKQ